jgi:hypothetical protein
LSFVVFNQDSLPFESRTAAEVGAPKLIRTLLRARVLGLSTIRVAHDLDGSWWNIELAPRFRWSDLVASQSNREEQADLRRALLSLATSTESPLIPEAEELATEQIVSCRLSEESAERLGLTAAFCLNAPLGSHSSHDRWQRDFVEISIEVLAGSEELRVESRQLMNLHSVECLETHRRELIERRDLSLRSGNSLCNSLGDLFPSLTFCRSAEESLRTWRFGENLLSSVRNVLTEFERFCFDWQQNKFEGYSHEQLRGYVPNLSDESSSVLQNPSLRAARVFRLPSGAKELFRFHVKLQNGFRVHYLPNGSDRRICVGYIGKHLPL